MDIDALDSAYYNGMPLVENKIYDIAVSRKGHGIRKNGSFEKVIKSPRVYLQPKFNGVFCSFRVENNQIVSVNTRGGKCITHLAEFITLHTTTTLSDYDGAGELIIPDDDAVVILTSYINQKKPKVTIPITLMVYEINRLPFP